MFQATVLLAWDMFLKIKFNSALLNTGSLQLVCWAPTSNGTAAFLGTDYATSNSACYVAAAYNNLHVCLCLNNSLPCAGLLCGQAVPLRANLATKPAVVSGRSRQTAVKATAMVNVDFASPSLVLGAALITAGVVLLQVRASVLDAWELCPVLGACRPL